MRTHAARGGHAHALGRRCTAPSHAARDSKTHKPETCSLSFLRLRAQVLSVATALSIQAHPDKALAERLFAERPDVYKAHACG